ncbi:branched-chain amino acid ABC transporter permease [Variovorax humicola]|uniref:Branched-chain amino acid ABC transporter permease n=1 Tax=Variovorax humicola TaxID=1769758 RepID=A0ABU8W335_9BURK
METFINQVVSGLSSGGIYATLALALVMIFKSTSRINFAQGEMAMFSTYLAWMLITAGVPYWLAFLGTVALAFAMGAMIERVIIRPLRDAPALSMVVVSVGLLVILNSLAGWIFTYTIKTFPSPFPASAPFGLTFVSWHELGSLAVTLLVVAALFAFFRYTSLGLAMRAAAQNAESSRLVGIKVGWMLALGWGIAAAIGSTAGMLVAPKVFLDPYMMSGVLIYAFAAALIGGIDSPAGAIVGGFIVGLLENLAGAYIIGDELKLTLALVVIVGVLLVKPAGLFGQVLVKRV